MAKYFAVVIDKIMKISLVINGNENDKIARITSTPVNIKSEFGHNNNSKKKSPTPLRKRRDGRESLLTLHRLSPTTSPTSIRSSGKFRAALDAAAAPLWLR